MTLTALLDRLSSEGVEVDAEAVLAEDRRLAADPLEAELPWYLRAIVGVGAWLTAMFVLFWLVFAVVVFARMKSGFALAALSGVLGMASLVVSMAAAWWPELVGSRLRRQLLEDGDVPPEPGRGGLFARTVALDFLGQLAVVGVLAGQGGFAVGVLAETSEEVALALLVLQSLVLFTNPHFVLRFASAAGLGVWAMLLEDELFGSRELTLAAVTLAMVAVWLSRPLWLRTRAWAAHGPIGHGLAAFVLVAHVLANDTLGQPVVNGLAAVTVVVWLLWEARVGGLGIVIGLVLCLAAAVATVSVPGVMLSLVVLGLGARAGDRVLQGGAIAGLLGYGLYDTVIWDVGHTTRFAVLLGLGIGFLLSAALLGRAAEGPELA
ncbi:MAG: DUF4401 domain-containing protein [Deltaproteobacteria bacterium]|nr:MAG: DUF4401 domain-containing protein [Deltaproteobacteria bacterium]